MPTHVLDEETLKNHRLNLLRTYIARKWRLRVEYEIAQLERLIYLHWAV